MDATHKCILKFGTKDFPLICYAAVDIQRKAHRVGYQLSSNERGVDYKFGMEELWKGMLRVISPSAVPPREFCGVSLTGEQS